MKLKITVLCLVAILMTAIAIAGEAICFNSPQADLHTPLFTILWPAMGIGSMLMLLIACWFLLQQQILKERERQFMLENPGKVLAWRPAREPGIRIVMPDGAPKVIEVDFSTQASTYRAAHTGCPYSYK